MDIRAAADPSRVIFEYGPSEPNKMELELHSLSHLSLGLTLLGSF